MDLSNIYDEMMVGMVKLAHKPNPPIVIYSKNGILWKQPTQIQS